MQQQYLTASEAAQLLRLNPEVVARKAHRGELKGYRLGQGQRSQWLFTEEDLKSCLIPNFKGKR